MELTYCLAIALMSMTSENYTSVPAQSYQDITSSAMASDLKTKKVVSSPFESSESSNVILMNDDESLH